MTGVDEKVVQAPDNSPQETPPQTGTVPTDAQVEFYKALENRLRTEYENRLEIWKRTELSALEAKMDDKVRDGLKELYDKWKEEQKPPSPADIEKMVSQEYITFKVKLLYEDGTEKYFTIRELPGSIERKFYRQFKERLKEYGPQLAAFTQAQLGQTADKTIADFLESFDNAFEVLADAVVLCLNPFGKDPEITNQWVQDNVSAQRQWNITQAQMEVNRLRDFFSQLYQAGRKLETMTTAPSFQELQRQLR